MIRPALVALAMTALLPACGSDARVAIRSSVSALPTTSAPSKEFSQSIVPAETLLKVTTEVGSYAVDDAVTPPPQTAQAVFTTFGGAERLLGYPSAGPDTRDAAFLAVLTGQFVCETDCIGEPHAAGTVLAVVIDWSKYRNVVDVTNATAGLGALGKTFGLDISMHRLITEPGPPCTAANLSVRQTTTMPTPMTLSQTLTIEPGTDLVQLSPAAVTPTVTAQHAWAEMVPGPYMLSTANGPVELILGYLYSASPAQIQNYTWPPTASNPDTASKPIYTHKLVWALYAQHQAEQAIGGSAGGSQGPRSTQTIPTATPPTTVAIPICGFQSVDAFVDATTGQMIFQETFTPGQ